jgi:hypothetical protein
MTRRGKSQEAMHGRVLSPRKRKDRPKKSLKGVIAIRDEFGIRQDSRTREVIRPVELETPIDDELDVILLDEDTPDFSAFRGSGGFQLPSAPDSTPDDDQFPTPSPIVRFGADNTHQGATNEPAVPAPRSRERYKPVNDWGKVTEMASFLAPGDTLKIGYDPEYDRHIQGFTQVVKMARLRGLKLCLVVGKE